MNGFHLIIKFSSILFLLAYVNGAEKETCMVDDQSENSSTRSCEYKDALFIENGIVVNSDMQQKANVYIENGIIENIGAELKAPKGVRVINADGKYVMPGGIDPHTHLDMPFMGTTSIDDFVSGQISALTGGTTMHIDFILPEDKDLMKGYNSYLEKSKDSVIDYSFHAAITQWNEKVAADMAYLVDKGINSFKFFLAYKGVLQVTDEELIYGFEECKRLGALPMVHAENGDAVFFGQKKIFDLGITAPYGHALSRPALLEGEATARAIKIAKLLNVPLYVVHVMSKNAVDEIAKARKEGQRVIGEPVISGLALDESYLWNKNFTYASQYVMSPPIRSIFHQKHLKNALANNILQLVGTDHCTFNSSQKAVGKNDFRKIPNGVNGIGERMLITWETMVNSGLISVTDFVRITSTACAQIFNIYPKKGAIMVGSDADLIIFDPNSTTTISTTTHMSKSDTNVYEGWIIKGRVDVTVSRGKVVWENGQVLVKRGQGKFVFMKTHGSLFEGIASMDDRILSAMKSFEYGTDFLI